MRIGSVPVGSGLVVGDLVAKHHQAVVEMNVFYDDILIMYGEVVVAEIPEAADTDAVELFGNVGRSFLRDAQDRYIHKMFLTKLLQFRCIFDRDIVDRSADLVGVVVKNAHKLKAAGCKADVYGDRLAKIACADEDRFISV